MRSRQKEIPPRSARPLYTRIYLYNIEFKKGKLEIL